jgi:hypothetical protein
VIETHVASPVTRPTQQQQQHCNTTSKQQTNKQAKQNKTPKINPSSNGEPGNPTRLLCANGTFCGGCKS